VQTFWYYISRRDDKRNDLDILRHLPLVVTSSIFGVFPQQFPSFRIANRYVSSNTTVNYVFLGQLESYICDTSHFFFALDLRAQYLLLDYADTEIIRLSQVTTCPSCHVFYCVRLFFIIIVSRDHWKSRDELYPWDRTKINRHKINRSQYLAFFYSAFLFLTVPKLVFGTAFCRRTYWNTSCLWREG